MTVSELLKECVEQIEKGNGNKEVLIARHAEGNAFHPLSYGFTDENVEEYDIWGHGNIDGNIHILLG